MTAFRVVVLFILLWHVRKVKSLNDPLAFALVLPISYLIYKQSVSTEFLLKLSGYVQAVLVLGYLALIIGLILPPSRKKIILPAQLGFYKTMFLGMLPW